MKIEYQPQLVEEAVLRKISGNPEGKQFRKERDKIYEIDDKETRESDFVKLNQNWFQRLGLANAIFEVLKNFPILETSVARLVFFKSSSPKKQSAELFVSKEGLNVNVKERQSILVSILPELFCEGEKFLKFLRFEFLHIADILDLDFGYKLEPQKDVYDYLFQQRYTILWNTTINGRLYAKGWAFEQERAQNYLIFKEAFPLEDSDAKKFFNYFFFGNSHNHDELSLFAKKTENWIVGSKQQTHKGKCKLCSFPTFKLISEFPESLLGKIRKDFEDFEQGTQICQQCFDLYDSRNTVN
ncbi:hypothetical protein IT568_04310 [bacterium]|nr:hypothetical protein [bacterium]